LQLVFLNQFYEHIQLDMHHTASEPTSKPMQPQAPILGHSQEVQELLG